MISLPHSLVIDRLCTGCIGTRWIQYSRSHRGATKHISSWKIEVNGKCKKALKRGETSFATMCFVLFFSFFLFTKQQQKVDDESQRKEMEIRFNLCPCFLLSFVSSCSLLTQALERTLSTQPGGRWRNKPHRREPNNRGRCPETQFFSRQGVSRATLSKYLSLSPAPLFS